MNETEAPPFISASKDRPASLLGIFWKFFYIGLVGFGGAMAIVALMQRECVEKDHMISEAKFSHGVALGQVLGAFSVNAAFFVGYQLAGLAGGLAAVTGFLLPSFWIVIGLSYLYFQFHRLLGLQSALNGIGPVVIALILWAAYTLARPIGKSWVSLLIAAAACFAAIKGVGVIVILFCAGGFSLLRHYFRKAFSR